MKKVGNLNHLVLASLHSILAPVAKLVKLDGKEEENFPSLSSRTAFSERGDRPVEHNSPSDDFSAYIESASESEVARPAESSGWVTHAAAAGAGISVPEISFRVGVGRAVLTGRSKGKTISFIMYFFIILIFVLFGLLSCQMTFPLAVTQSFSRVATFYGQVSNAHLGVTIDFQDLGHFIGFLDKPHHGKNFQDKSLLGTSVVLAI